MQKSFQLFSDEVKSGNQQLLYSTFLANLQKVFKNVRMYSSTHRLVLTALAELKSNTKNLFEHHQALVIVRIGGKMITPEVQLPVTDPKIVDLAKMMNLHQIRKIRLWLGMTNGNIVELCKIIAMKPEELLEAGGIRFLLAQANISKIEVEVASHSASSEHGTAGMFEAMGHGEAVNKTWLMGLKKVGINEEHFIDYLRHKPTRSPMLQRELQLAVQAFSNPREVAELLIYLSTDPNDPDNISPEVMFKLMQRIENVILMHSGIAEQEIVKKLTNAARMLPETLRLELLYYYCNATLNGEIISSFKLFSFAYPEYYEVILDEFSEAGTMHYIAILHLSRASLDGLLKYCRQRLGDELDAVQLEQLISSLRQAAGLKINNLTSPQLLEPPELDSELLSSRIAELQPNLELGYLYVLTAFMVNEKNETRMLDICARLASLLDFYLNRQDYETLIPIFTQFTKLDDVAMKIFNQVYWGHLSAQQLIEISNFFLRFSAVNQQESAELLLALQQYLPDDFVPQLLLRITHKRTFPAYRFIIQMLNMGQEPDALYTELLASKDINDKIAAFDLMTISHDPQAEMMLIDRLQTRQTGVGARLGIIFMLASFTGETSILVLSNIAAGKAKTGLSAYTYRRAAVMALSMRRDATTIPVLKDIIKRRKLWRRDHQFELRFGAALALDKISTVEATKILNDNIDKLQRTYLRYIIDGINSFIQKELRFIKRAVMFVINPIIFVITTLWHGIMNLFRLVGLSINFFWKLICTFSIYLAGIPLKFIKLITRLVFSAGSTLKLLLISNRKSLVDPNFNDEQQRQGVKK